MTNPKPNLITRLITNFRISILTAIPYLTPLHYTNLIPLNDSHRSQTDLSIFVPFISCSQQISPHRDHTTPLLPTSVKVDIVKRRCTTFTIESLKQRRITTQIRMTGSHTIRSYLSRYLVQNDSFAPQQREIAIWIQLAVDPQPLRLRNHDFKLAHRIMVKRLETSRHDPLGITDSACKNQLVVVSVQYNPFNTYIPIRSTTIGKSRVARDPIAMYTSWRSNSDIASVTSIGYPRMRASGESSTTNHRLLHASGPHPIPPPNDPKTNQYNQDLGLIHSTNGNHLESPNEGSSIDHQVTIHLHAQNITMFPTNETWPKNLKISKLTKIGPISNIGPKTSWAARDRPEQNLEVKFSRRNDAGDSPDGGRTAAAAANGRTLPRQARRLPSPSCAIARSTAPTSAQQFVHGLSASEQQPCGQRAISGRPSRGVNGRYARQVRTSRPLSSIFVAQPSDEHRPALAQQLRKASGPLAGQRAAIMRDYRTAVHAIARSRWRRRTRRRMLPEIFFVSIDSKFKIQMQYGSIVLKDPSHSSDTTVGEPSTTGRETPSSAFTRRPDEISTDGFSSKGWSEQLRRGAAAPRGGHGGGGVERRERRPRALGLGLIGMSYNDQSPKKSHFQNPLPMLNTLSSVSVRESRIQYLCDPQWFRDTASRGPTTIVAPESQFWTCPSDHGKSV
ncbi:hypothetical protein F511_23413 [Dorcoceras hygrometricum]|uniref:Uncharacterized protein n=1 Tax=Dorcoceras hygrometricum TaxID=472368 RepID=A0A2Z7A830_9LAMI|nr:hypothetical protein F511_23413 [Dorcoceras hygrometricum]